MLVSYQIACSKYSDPAQANLVKGFLTYTTSAEGQQAAAQAAGSAPLPDQLRWAAGFPGRLVGRGSSQRFTLLAAFTALATFALLLFGSHVTATDSALVFPDWPLMGGTLIPPLTEATSAHVLHRWVAVVVGILVAAVAVTAWRTQHDRPTIVRLALASAALYAIQIVVGGLQVLTGLSGWSQTLHLGLGAVIFALFVGLAVTSFYTARTTLIGPPTGPTPVQRWRDGHGRQRQGRQPQS